MMGHKTVEPKLYVSFSLDAAVPTNHLVRRLAAVVDFDFVRGLVRRDYSHTGQPSVDPIVLFKLWLLGYLFNITSERRLCEEASLNLAWQCAPGPTDRMISRRWDAGVVEEMQDRLRSRRGRRLLKRRSTISERINADAKEKHGMDKAQFRGRAKMQMQALLTATAINLKVLANRHPEAQSGITAVGLSSLPPCSAPKARLRASRWTRLVGRTDFRHPARSPRRRRPR